MREYPWHGWGPAAGRPALSGRAERLLDTELGLTGRRIPPVDLARVRLPPARLDAGVRRGLEAVVGAGNVRDDAETRVRHAAGQSYTDLVRLRAGALDDAPDAVVLPGSHAEVRGVLDVCTAGRVAVVPFGGGTSVVGGVRAAHGPHSGLVTLDLSRLDRLVGVDRESLTATLEAGMTGAAAEAALDAHGLTLGHYPQSFERATVGGFAATRSAGQASTGYGGFADLVEGVRVATPSGDLVLGRAPASAAGPDLRALVAGSEGTLGVVTEVTVRVRPAPRARRYEGWSLPAFEGGLQALRGLVQAGLAPDVARLSDPAETRLSLALAGGAKGAGVRALLRLRGHGRGCLLVCGWEGAAPVVRWRRRHALRALRRHGARRLGRPAGEAWRRARFSAPYLRDELLDRGALVETVETATSWSGLLRLHAAVAAALRGALAAGGVPALVGSHVSHLYPTGASLYFTVLGRPREGAEIAQWQQAKEAASAAIAAAGATITHHHAVGLDHRRWLAAEIGPVGVAALQAVKARIDPAGILNPGKLLPGGGEAAGGRD